MPPAAAPGELAVHWAGREDDSPTLVLMHGLTDSGSCWPDAVARWESEYRIAAVDALGHGSSPRYTPEQLTGDVMEAMYDAAVACVSAIAGAAKPVRGDDGDDGDDGDGGHGLRPVVLVGHSMGGGICAAIAARRPELVRAVVLEDPAWLDDADSRQRQLDAYVRVAECQAVRDDLEAAVRSGHDENPRWPLVEIEPWARAKAEADLAFLATGQAWVRQPWQDVAAAISVPTLLVTGTDGVIIDGPKQEAVRAVNPRIEVHVVPGAGHCVRRDDPAAFHEVVDRWIAAQVASADA